MFVSYFVYCSTGNTFSISKKEIAEKIGVLNLETNDYILLLIPCCPDWCDRPHIVLSSSLKWSDYIYNNNNNNNNNNNDTINAINYHIIDKLWMPHERTQIDGVWK